MKPPLPGDLLCAQQSGTESSDECETHSLAKKKKEKQPMQAESLCIWSGTPSIYSLRCDGEKNFKKKITTSVLDNLAYIWEIPIQSRASRGSSCRFNSQLESSDFVGIYCISTGHCDQEDSL